MPDTQCRPTGLFVGLGTTNPNAGSIDWRDDGRRAWRIYYADGAGCERALPLPFARTSDAECALQAIRDIHAWTGSVADVARSIRRYGWDRLRQTMVEAMQW